MRCGNSYVLRPYGGRTFLHTTDLLGVAHESPDGSEAITGHKLRVAGAQGLVRMGLLVAQVHTRWGGLSSDAPEL